MDCHICTGAIVPWERRRIAAELDAGGLTEAEAFIAHKRCYLVNRHDYTFHAAWVQISTQTQANVD